MYHVPEDLSVQFLPLKKRALLNTGLDPSFLNIPNSRETLIVFYMFDVSFMETLSNTKWFFLKETTADNILNDKDDLIISDYNGKQVLLPKVVMTKLPAWFLLCVELHLTARIANNLNIAASKIQLIIESYNRALVEARYLNSLEMYNNIPASINDDN